MNKSFTFLVVPLLFYLSCVSVSAAADPVSYTITVSATIGEPKLILFGYSSPFSRVELRGNRVYEQTIANPQGYFFFDRIFLPRPNPDYPELCLTAVDTQQRTSFPECLPPLPVGPFDIRVGPVLLSPTISLERGSFLSGEQIVAQGATIPNTEVTIFLASDPSRGNPLTGVTPVRKVYAYPLPKYHILSDQNGHFEFNLPTNWPSSWRTFAAAVYLDSPTPKSNTLTFKVLFWWQWLIEKLKLIFLAFLGLLGPHLWPLIVLVEVIIILWLLRKRKSSEANLYPLRQNSVFHSRLNEILPRRQGRDIKDRPT